MEAKARPFWTSCAALLVSLLATLALGIHFRRHSGWRTLPSAPRWPLQPAIDAFVAAPLPPRNTNISVERPLFFIHQRKAGGTSMRAALLAAAESANLPHYIPCVGSAPCGKFEVNNTRGAVYAGHFPWRDFVRLHKAKYADNTRPGPGGSGGYQTQYPASCTTLFRDPVARVESCYYYRIVRHHLYTEERFKCLSNLSASELRDVFIAGRSLNPGWGCGNEPFRLLSGFIDDVDVHAMSLSDPGSPAFSAGIALALSHLASCVPLVLEDPSSMQLAQHWFPQLRAAFDAAAFPHENQGKAERCPLSDGARAVLEELTVAERELYDAARRRVKYMLASLPVPPRAVGRKGGVQSSSDSREFLSSATTLEHAH